MRSWIRRTNERKKTGFSSIDEYIAACPEETPERLQRIRAAIKKVAPKAKEKISYQMPAFELNPGNFIAFERWKKHVSIYSIPAKVIRLHLAENLKNAKIKSD